MAKTKAPAKPAKKTGGKKPSELVEVAIAPTIKIGDHSGLPRTYANFLHISRTSADFTLVFGDVESPAEAEQQEILKAFKDGKEIVMYARPVAKIAVPNHLVERILAALSNVYDSYKREQSRGGSTP